MVIKLTFADHKSPDLALPADDPVFVMLVNFIHTISLLFRLSAEDEVHKIGKDTRNNRSRKTDPLFGQFTEIIVLINCYFKLSLNIIHFLTSR